MWKEAREKYRSLSGEEFSQYLIHVTGYDDEEFSTLYCGGCDILYGGEDSYMGLEEGFEIYAQHKLERSDLVETDDGRKMTVDQLLQYNQLPETITSGAELHVDWWWDYTTNKGYILGRP